jgi:FkbM family methyltransferase
MMKILLSIYRSLPWFKGKLRLGKLLFSNYVNASQEFTFKAHDGVTYAIPNTLENIGLELIINGVYEKEVLDFLKTNMKDHSVFFDVGANIGSIGIPVAKTKKAIDYHCFEAAPDTFDYLQKNIASNQLASYQSSNCLVHHTSGISHRFYVSALHGKNSLAPTYSNDYIEVGAVTIDDYCRLNGIQHIDWMKIDVQGFELFVFQGAKELLQNKLVQNILFENEPWAEDQAGIERGKAQQFLLDCGYSLFDMEGQVWNNLIETRETMIWAKCVG